MSADSEPFESGIHKNPTRKVKRNYVPALCKYCQNIVWINQYTVGLCCPSCDTYIRVGEAIEAYRNYVPDESKSPSLIRVTETGEGYRKLRDEMQIRSDLYVRGVRRDRIGPQKFNKMLKKELIHEKCYRGDASGC